MHIDLPAFSRHRMDLFNQFHRVRRVVRDSDNYRHVESSIPAWLELLEKIDAYTTLEQRFDLIGTNAADRKRITDMAIRYSAPLTMQTLLDPFKGGNSAMHRERRGELRDYDRLGAYLGWYVIMHLPDGVAIKLAQQFFGGEQD